ncbi:MAG: LLM class F420-dependent oxidoreductase [Acidimicrobiales bacterium]
MKFGVFLPQREIGADLENLLVFVRAVEAAGFSFLQATDHVLGADPATRTGWDGPYDVHDLFHEPFVFYGYLAAVTKLDLVTAVLILPQRQTALVAKQAAELDILTRGRFRLGVGVGWNDVEYEALGIDFRTRGARCEEQVEVLRRLWCEESVDFEGRFHRIDRAGILPRPIQRPIPIWIGGGATTRVLERIGRLGDGWLHGGGPGESLDRALEIIHRAARDARRPEPPGLQVGLRVSDLNAGDFERAVEESEKAGASYVSIRGDNPIDPNDPVRSLDQYLEMLGFATTVLAERLKQQG